MTTPSGDMSAPSPTSYPMISDMHVNGNLKFPKSNRRAKMKQKKLKHKKIKTRVYAAPKLVSKRRPLPPGYIAETAKINENKKKPENQGVHKFVAAEWTHSNGHPRCLKCGQEQPISSECNREPTKAEEDAWRTSLANEFSKAHFDPLEPRDINGRWNSQHRVQDLKKNISDTYLPPGMKKKVLENGTFIKPSQFKVVSRAEAADCHILAQQASDKGLGTWITGWGQERSGEWVSHSWLRAPSGKNIELTNWRPRNYFGAPVAEEDKLAFKRKMKRDNILDKPGQEKKLAAIKRISKHNFNPNELRDFHGRWGRGGNRRNRAAVLAPSPSRARRSSAVSGVATPATPRAARGSFTEKFFDHKAKSITPEGMKTAPRPNRGAPPHYLGIVDEKKMLPRPKALYERRSITDARLKELYLHPEKATVREKVLIASSRAVPSVDGTHTIKNVDTPSGSRKDFTRATLIAQLAGRMTPGSGNRSAKPAKELLPADQQTRIDAKRRKTDKVSSIQMDAYRKEIVTDWGDDEGNVLCVFCASHIKGSHKNISVEKAKPAALGGTYTDKANRWPSHTKCNTLAGSRAQADPQTYLEDMMRQFVNLPLTPAQRKQLGFVYARYRKYLGAVPKGGKK